MAFTELTIRSQPEAAKAVAEQAMAAHHFRMTWQTPWDALAERGSKVGNFFGGAFAQYFAMRVSVRQAPQGAVLRIEKGNSGWMGGLVGAHRVKKEFERISTGVSQHLAASGVLVGQNSG